MTSYGVLGSGSVGAFGCGKNDLLKALSSGSVTPKSIPIATDTGEISLQLCEADLSGLKDYFANRLIRRYNRFTKMVALAAQQAVVDAGVTDSIDRSRLGLILATGHGPSVTTFEFLDSYHEDDNSYVSPMTFSNSVLSAAVSATTILMDITGPALTVHQLEASVPLALDTAKLWLDSDRADYVLVGGCDEYCDVLGYTYACQFGASSPAIDIRHPSKQTAFPGEGAAFLLLGNASEATDQTVLLDTAPMDETVADAAIIGFDGHAACRLPYAPFYQSPPSPTLSLANLFGSLPAAMMLDIAAAVAMIKNSCNIHSSLMIHPDRQCPDTVESVDIIKAQSDRDMRTIRVMRGGKGQ